MAVAPIKMRESDLAPASPAAVTTDVSPCPCSSSSLPSYSLSLLQVNSAGVMPIIFASSLMALPSTLGRFTDSAALASFSNLISSGGGLYLPVNVILIAFFNYFYTFLQLEPKDVADQLKKQGASIPGVRPGISTRDYITTVLERLSLLVRNECKWACAWGVQDASEVSAFLRGSAERLGGIQQPRFGSVPTPLSNPSFLHPFLTLAPVSLPSLITPRGPFSWGSSPALRRSWRRRRGSPPSAGSEAPRSSSSSGWRRTPHARRAGGVAKAPARELRKEETKKRMFLAVCPLALEPTPSDHQSSSHSLSISISRPHSPFLRPHRVQVRSELVMQKYDKIDEFYKK